MGKNTDAVVAATGEALTKSPLVSKDKVIIAAALALGVVGTVVFNKIRAAKSAAEASEV